MSLKLCLPLDKRIQSATVKVSLSSETLEKRQREINNPTRFTFHCTAQFSLALNSKTERRIDMKFNYIDFPFSPIGRLQSLYIPGK
jgi:hypothetical protein